MKNLLILSTLFALSETASAGIISEELIKTLFKEKKEIYSIRELPQNIKNEIDLTLRDYEKFLMGGSHESKNNLRNQVDLLIKTEKCTSQELKSIIEANNKFAAILIPLKAQEFARLMNNFKSRN